MDRNSVLVANRGEIAIRIVRAAGELGMRTVAVYSDDDAERLHVRRADEARPLQASGPAAYLDAEQIVAAATEAGCGLLHPGYGFLSENAAFARRCAEAGVTFVGPAPETLDLFGDKAQGRALAARVGVPVLAGTTGATTLDEAEAFLASLGEGGAVMVKAIAGGGGRGMRPVTRPDQLAAAFDRCRSEAERAFGRGDLYVEELLTHARHIEVQIVGDGSGRVRHLGERECTIQRHHQKLIELAPSPWLDIEARRAVLDAAVRMAEEVRFANVGTFEFLVSAGEDGATRFAFIEANPRLQVEHTVTEEVTAVDLVQTQLRLAVGADLSEVVPDEVAVNGFAIQLRVNMESMSADGTAVPAGGTLGVFEIPAGPGVRVDTFGYSGYRTSPRFDSLLAKVIVHNRSADFGACVTRAERALADFRIEGVPTNIGFLANLLDHSEFRAGNISTHFVEDHIGELVDTEAAAGVNRPATAGLAGAKIDTSDPLAVLHHGKSAATGSAAPISAPSASPVASAAELAG